MKGQWFEALGSRPGVGGRWSLLLTLLCVLPAIGSPAAAGVPNVESAPEARKELHVTAYRAGSQDTAFLREVREVDMPAGQVKIALRGVPETVQRETVSIRVLDGPPVEVLEQTFSYDVITPASLMHAAEGTGIVVEVEGVHDGKLRPVDAQVMASGRDGTVLRTREGYTFGLGEKRKRFTQVPDRLTPRPTLTWHAKSSLSGVRKIEISYLLTGLRWSADYVATLSRFGRHLDLSGWVTFKNDTDVWFEDTNLAVAAGTIHRAAAREGRMILLGATNRQAAGFIPNEAVRETLGHLHLYKIPQPTDLKPRSIKNVRLLNLARVPVDRTWVTSFHVRPSSGASTRSERPSLKLEMRNDEEAGGVPIPAGTVRVMVPDRTGTPHMVASSQVVDTPKGEKLKIDMGPVADVKVRLVPKDYRSSLLGSKEATYSLELRNGSPNAGVVQVDLRAGSNTTLDVKGAKVARPSAATWRVEVPLGPGAARTFRVVATVERPRRSSR